MKALTEFRSLLALTMACALPSTVLSDDLEPPSWRGDAGSTLQIWEFSNDDNPAAPDILNNPFGTPSATITPDPINGTGWWDTLPAVYGSKQGWWDIANGSIELDIPNRPNNPPGSYKLIQLQVTYWKDINQAPIVSVSPFAVQQGTTVSTLVEGGPMGGAWYSDLYLWRLDPNPFSETITLTGPAAWGSQIDQIVVDTICIVPEPASAVSAMLLGALAVWQVRRRQV